MFIEYNANPKKRRGDDCVIRAISKVLGMTWDDTYIKICLEGLLLKDMPSANHVWGAFLRKSNYSRHVIPNSCPDCYTVGDFAEDHPDGRYILALHGHVVALVDGNVYDTWNSMSETPLYYWKED